MIRILRNISLFAALTAVTTFSAAQEPVKLRFVSLAWQEQAIESVKEIVAAWNEANPDIQVEYQQVDWGSINDYMTTAFETGSVPDIFHNESVQVLDYGRRGYLTDLAPLISDDMKNDVVDGAWATVDDGDGALWGIPFLWESRIVLYNKDLFAEAGIEAPTVDDPWTWDDMREAAKKLTVDADGNGTPEQWGAAISVSSPVNMLLNLGVGFGAQYFYQDGDNWTVQMNDAERALPQLIVDMMYTDKTASTDGLGLSGPELFPGFFEGKYAMLPGIGVWARQQIVESGPENFNWGVLPPLVAETQEQGAQSQTLSIPEASQHKEEAMKFLSFFLDSENMATLAQGDWLFPTRKSSFERPEFQTEEADWDIATASAGYLTLAEWQKVPNFEEFKSRVGTPILQELFANRITVDEAAERMAREGDRALNR